MSARSKDRDAALNSHSRNKASPSAGMDPAKAADASANRTTVTRPISEPPPGSLSGVWRFFEERQDQAHANQCAQRPYHPHLRILQSTLDAACSPPTEVRHSVRPRPSADIACRSKRRNLA